MNEEEKILIEQLIEAICHPDWFMRIITIISICISGLLSFLLYRATKIIGRKQNEIAKHQIIIQDHIARIEKYNLFKDEIIVIREIQFYISSFLYEINSFLNRLEENEFDIFENELVRAYNKSNELLEKLRIIRNSGKFKILDIDDNDLMSIELLLENAIHNAILLLSHFQFNKKIDKEIISIDNDEIDDWDIKLMDHILKTINQKGYKCEEIIGHLRYYAKGKNDILYRKNIFKSIEHHIYDSCE